MSNEMLDFATKNPKINLKKKLEAIKHQIASDLFNISKVVKDDSFHTLLIRGQENKLNLSSNEIPVCCKIDLEGFSPPLNIRVAYIDEK